MILKIKLISAIVLLSIIFSLVGSIAVDETMVTDSTQTKEESEKRLVITYQNGMLDADIKGSSIREIFEEFKKQVGINYEIEKEILEQKVTISFKEKELAEAIKEILNTIGNPSYMLSYKKNKSKKYVVSGITIRKRGTTETNQVKKIDLQDGEMEVGLVNGKYRIIAKNADVNELLGRLSNIGGIHDKIVADKIDKKINFEGEDTDITIMLRHIFREIRPKIYNVAFILPERDRNNKIINPGYNQVTQLSDAEILQRREESEKTNKEGEKLMKEGRYREAIDTFGGAVDPDYIIPTINEGKIYLLNREYSKAIRLFNCVLDIDSTNAETYYNLIEAYEKDGQLDKKLDSMEKYVLFSKDEKKVKEVRQKLETLKDKQTEKYFSLIKKGDDYLNKHDLDKAKVQYEEAIKIKPEDVTAFRKLAELYENSKDFKKSEEIYQMAIKRDESNFELYLRLSIIEINLGKKAEAINLMEKAKTICPLKDTILKIDQMIESVKQEMKDGK